MLRSRPALTVAIMLAFCSADGNGGEPAPEKKTAAALLRPSPLDFVQTRLADVIAFLEGGHGVNFFIDELALGDIGLSAETPVTVRLAHASLGEALTLMLHDVGLTWTVHDGVIVVTTPEEEESSFLTTVVYDVRDLAAPAGQDVDGELRSIEALEELLGSVTAPETWDYVGGYGSLRSFRQALIVSQTRGVHREMARLLAELRRVKSAPPGQPASGSAFQRALGAPFSLLPRRFPLEELVEILRDETELDVMLDRRALDDLGLSDRVEVGGQFDNDPLKVALTEMLRPAELAWVRRFDVLVITTEDEAEAAVSPRVYDVRELTASGKGAAPPLTYGEVLDLCVSLTAPDTWEIVGGPGSAAPFDGMLVIRQSDAVHEKIEMLLAHVNEAKRAAAQNLGAKRSSPAAERRVTCDFSEAPLGDTLRFLERYCDGRIVLHEADLDEVGLSAEAPVSLRLNDVRLETALDLALGQLALAWYRRDGAIHVTTPEAAESDLDFSIYPVGDLLEGPDDDNDAAARELIAALKETVAPESWDEVGGPGSMIEAGGLLVVSQTQPIRRRIGRILDDLRSALATPDAGPAANSSTVTE